MSARAARRAVVATRLALEWALDDILLRDDIVLTSLTLYAHYNSVRYTNNILVSCRNRTLLNTNLILAVRFANLHLTAFYGNLIHVSIPVYGDGSILCKAVFPVDFTVDFDNDKIA
jgi:hypothetical protein